MFSERQAPWDHRKLAQPRKDRALARGARSLTSAPRVRKLRPSELPASPMVMCTAPQGSTVKLFTGALRSYACTCPGRRPNSYHCIDILKQPPTTHLLQWQLGSVVRKHFTEQSSM